MQVRSARGPGRGYECPLGVDGRLLVGTHKCPDHQHRTYFCQPGRRTAFDPPVAQGCREAPRMGTPDGALTV